MHPLSPSPKKGVNIYTDLILLNAPSWKYFCWKEVISQSVRVALIIGNIGIRQVLGYLGFNLHKRSKQGKELFGTFKQSVF